MPKLSYQYWKGYSPRLSTKKVAVRMSEYDASRFIPRPALNQKTGKWEDTNLANRKKNNWPAKEVERILQGYQGHGGPDDVAIRPHPIPKGAAGPEKYPSPQDYERAQTTFQAVQGSIRSSSGVPSTEAALGVTPINEAIRSGRLPIRVVGQAATIIERMQQEGKRTQDTHKQQLLNLGQKAQGESAWEFIPQDNLPKREDILRAYHQAQPAVHALQRKTMVNASRLAGKHVPLQTVKKFIPALSHQQLGFVQSKAPMKAQVAGPGGGKSAGLVAAIVDGLVNQGLTPEAALEEAVGHLFLSQTKSAGTTIANKLKGIEQLVPGWDAAQRSTQIHTFAHFGMSLLNKGQRTRGSLMQQMGLGSYKPLYEGEGATIEEEQAKRAHEQVLARVFEHHGLDKRVNNINQLTQSIAEVKGTTREELDNRMTQGRKQFASLQWKKDKIVSPDMALYLYQQAMHAKPGFMPKEQGGPRYDINDVPRLLVAASESPKVKNFPQFKNIVVDESQDTPEMMALALTRMLAPNGRLLVAGDASQQAIQRPWDINRALAREGAEIHPLEINFRTGRQGVADINPFLATTALADRPRSPSQVAFREHNTPTQYRVEKDFPTAYWAMASDWMRDMGLTPQMMAQSMQAGQSPFEQATTLPMEAPFIFQRGQEGRDVFLGQLKGLLGKHMSPDMVDQIMKHHVSTESPSPENVMKLHALTAGAVRGETVTRGYVDVGDQGLWGKAGRAGQLYTMLSRSSEQNLVYGSMSPGKGQIHDMTPGYIGGQQVPHGFDQLIAASAVNLVEQQGMRPEDMSPFMQGAYAQGAETGQGLADPEAIKQFAQMALFMEQFYSPAVGDDSGILRADPGLLDRDSGFAIGNLAPGGILNAKTIAGQSKDSAISKSKLDYADRLSHEMIMNGAPQVGRGKAILGPAGELLAEPWKLQTQRESVPSHEELMAQVHQAAGPIDANILMDPIEREAGSVFEEIDNAKMKEFAGENHFTEAGDITKMRRLMQSTLSVPSFRSIPRITSALEQHLTHPKVLDAAREAIVGEAVNNPSFAKHLRDRAPSLSPMDWDDKTNNWTTSKVMEEFQEYTKKEMLSKEQREHLLKMMQRQHVSDLEAHGEGGLHEVMRQLTRPGKGNSLYHPEIAHAIYGATAKVLPWKKLDPELIGLMGDRAATFAASPLHTESEAFWNNAAKSFQGYSQDVHENGLQLSWKELERIGKQDPLQARLLENIFGDEKSGELLPYTHPDVKRAVSEIVYRQGKVLRSIDTPQEAAKMRVPLSVSRNAPAHTEFKAFYSALQGGNWENHGAGAADAGAVYADPLVPGTETAKDDDYVFRPLGSGAPLHAQEARYRDLANNPHMSAKKRAAFQEQHDLVKHVRSQFGSPSNQRDWAHLMRVILLATSSEHPTDLRKGAEYQIDPIRKWFRNRDANMPDARSLPRLAQLGGALSSASAHLQKTGTIKRSHVDEILHNFGFDPKDKRFSALRKLEKEAGFHRNAGADPELAMQKLIAHYPEQRKAMHEQLTRVPLLYDERYTFMGGQPGYASIKDSQKRIPAGIEGTLHPITENQGFGLSAMIKTHRKHKMFDGQEWELINPKKEKMLPDAVANQQHLPLMQFRGTHKGEEYRFPVNPDQLAFTDPARAKSQQGIRDVMRAARWTRVRWDEQDKNKEHIAALARTADAKRRRKQGWPTSSDPVPMVDQKHWQSLMTLTEQERLPLVANLAPAASKKPVAAKIPRPAKPQVEAAPPQETVHFQGQWMPKEHASALKSMAQDLRGPVVARPHEKPVQEQGGGFYSGYWIQAPQIQQARDEVRRGQHLRAYYDTLTVQHHQRKLAEGLVSLAPQRAIPERPMAESYRGYELGPDITRAVVDKIIASQQSTPVEPPQREPVDSRQMLLPGFGSGQPPVPPTPPTAPIPEPEPEEGGRIPAPSSPSNLHQMASAPLAIGGSGLSVFSPATPREALVSHRPAKPPTRLAQSLWDAEPGFPSEPHASLGPSSEEMPRFLEQLSALNWDKAPQHVAKDQSLQTKPPGTWDTDPHGFPPELPQENYYSGPSEEELGSFQHALGKLDWGESGLIPSVPKVGKARIVASKKPKGVPYDVSDLPGLMRSPHRMHVRDGMIRPYSAKRGGVAVGGLAKEQRAALDDPSQHLVLQGGPGTGKTDVEVMKAADLIAKGHVAPEKTLAFSGMHSGVEEINARFDAFLRPLLPSKERHRLPMARTIHSVAHQMMFPGNKPSHILGEMGMDWIQGIMSNPSEEELAQQTPAAREMMRDGQYKYLRDALALELPHAKWLPQTREELDPVLKSIGKYKSDREGGHSLYEKNMRKGKADLGQGLFTHASALAAYEQNLPQGGKIDFHDEIHIARQMLEHSGKEAIPDHLRGTQMVMYDEAQDSNRENTAFIAQLIKTLGPETRSIIGLDPLQALFQGEGSASGDQIIPSFQKALGGAGHVQLRENFRSARKDVALNNAILQMKAMKGKKELSPLQIPHSQEMGHDPQFLLAKSQPNLYKQMFSSMLEKTGVPTDTIKENILKGAHPFEGVDWSAPGLTRPGEIPAIFSTHAQRELFSAVGPSVLENLAPGKITAKMAQSAFAQIHRNRLPGKAASTEEREIFDEKSAFRSLMVGDSRGLAFRYPHADVTVAGGWRMPGPKAIESYLHNLGVMVSRVKDGGQNVIGAASHPFSPDQVQQFRTTKGRHFREEQPTSLTQGNVWHGPGREDFITAHNKNVFETYQGQTVPPHFAEIMKLRDKQLTGWQGTLSSPSLPAKGNTSPIQSAIISIAGDATIKTPPAGKVTVAGTNVQVDIVRGSTPRPASPMAQPALEEALPPPLMTGGSSFVSPLGRQMARGGPLAQSGSRGFGGAPRVVGSTPQDQIDIDATGDAYFGGSGRKPPRGPTLSTKMMDYGRTAARIGGEMEFLGKTLNALTDKAIEQGSAYRRSSGMFAGSGATADRGFWDFANDRSGISRMQSGSLPMYSKTEIAKNLLDVSSMGGGSSVPTGTSTNILQLAALTGMDPTQLTSQLAGISGSVGQGMSLTPQLEGYIGNLYKGKVTASNLSPTLSAVGSALPTMQGLSFGQGDQLHGLFGLMGAAQAGGMTAANMPDVASLTNSLSQASYAPDLRQQAALSRLFPGQLTASPQLAQFQQQQLDTSQQIAGMQLQQQYHIPQLQLAIDNADIALQSANLDLSKIQLQQGGAEINLQKQQLNYSQAQLDYQNLQYQQSKASFGEQQYVNTQQLGPIGADVSRQSYFDFMRNQQAAGYNPLSAETGTQFKSSPVFGLQNAQFYAGIEHQRQDMVLSRSPLLSDAKFQEDSKYLNEQEAFYKQQLDLTNQQRQFEKDWTTKLLDAQGKLLPMQQGILNSEKGMLTYSEQSLEVQKNIYGIHQTQLGLAQQMNAYQDAQTKLQEKYLPLQIDALQKVQTALQQYIDGQGPVSGANPSPQDIIRQLSLIDDPTKQQQSIRNLGISPADTNTLMNILKGIKTEGGYDKAMAGTNPADKSIQNDINKLITSGAFSDQTAKAAAADASLNLGGTGGQWTKFVNAYNRANDYLKSIDTSLSSINDWIKGAGTVFSMLGPALTGIGMVLQGLGIGGKIAGWAAKGGASAALSTAAETIGGAATSAASTLSSAAVAAAPVLIPLIIAAVGTAAITFALKWMGDQASSIGQKNLNDPTHATQNLPSWLQWLPGKTASPEAIKKAQHAQDQYKATHHGQSMPMDAGSPFAKGTLLGDTWNGISGWFNNIIHPPKAEAAEADPHSPHYRHGVTPQLAIHPAYKAPTTGDMRMAQSKGATDDFQKWFEKTATPTWNKFWSDRGKDWNSFWSDRARGWNSWWSDRATGWSNWWIDRKKAWDSWWSDRATGWNNWWSDRKKGWDSWWNDRATAWNNWWSDRRKDWGNWWTDRAKDWGNWWADRGKDINNLWQGAIGKITDFFNPGSKNNVGNLIGKAAGDALSKLNWGSFFKGIFGGGGGEPSKGSEPAGHPGFTTPHVNTEFGAQMWYGKHQGVDFAAAQGSSLREFVGGTVSNTGQYAWGGEVDVTIPGGLTERYLHLSGINVKKGDKVPRGSFLGATGGGTVASGLGYWSSGSHLHTQFDHGDYNGGVNPWPIWRGFGAMNLSQYIGGFAGNAAGTVGHLFTGGVAMRPQIKQIAEHEPEAVIPLSKLSEVLKNLPSKSATQTQAATQQEASPSRTIHVANLIGSATFAITTSGSGQLDEKAQDDLMHQVLSLIESALQQANGKA